VLTTLAGYPYDTFFRRGPATHVYHA